MSVTQRRAVCLALVATVVFRVPLMRLGDATDADNAISPLDVVASQLVLPVEHGANGAKRNKAQADGDPGDLVRALLYPGELGRSVLDSRRGGREGGGQPYTEFAAALCRYDRRFAPPSFIRGTGSGALCTDLRA